MVLSLSLPSFSRSPSISPRRASDPKKPGPSTSTSTSNSTTNLSRNNRFPMPLRFRSLSSLPPPAPIDNNETDHEELNHALLALALIFPDIKTEVFREMVVRFDGTSRLEVCVEQLLRYKEKWVAGRWNVPVPTSSDPQAANTGTRTEKGTETETQTGTGTGLIIPSNELFRSPAYKRAVRAALTKEFSGLSKSVVDAVLAEVNFCYLRARPVLQDLWRKTWRATFNSFVPSLKRRRKTDRERESVDDNPLIEWRPRLREDNDGDMSLPRLKETTGCEELDRELEVALLAPVVRAVREAREEGDMCLARELNESEAREAHALFECECCLADVAFEQIATCSEDMHVICYECIQRTVQEALFGQGWGKAIDVNRSTVRCLAPAAHDDGCPGSLNAEVVKRAIRLGKAGAETYAKFETRLASDTLLKSQLKLIHCPFCSYAEVDPATLPLHANGIRWRLRLDIFSSTALTTLLLLIVLFIPYLLIPSSIMSSIIDTSLLNLCARIRSTNTKFRCANPTCLRSSCITCQKPWRDPHVCNEPLLLNLRATVEAARTAAIKRTCPVCNLSFVKSSGCNKLTCQCGYAMCYLCRKALGPRPPPLPLPLPLPRRRLGANIRRAAMGIPVGVVAVPENFDGDGDDDEEDEDEDVHDIGPEYHGDRNPYSHFCEHFRATPGARCTECSKCELYQDEDEEDVARKAGERAEREWRLKQGASTSTSSGAGAGAGAGGDAAVQGRGVLPVTGQVNRDFEFSRLKQEGKGGLLPTSVMRWVSDVWGVGGWRAVVQSAVDLVVERVVVIEGL